MENVQCEKQPFFVSLNKERKGEGRRKRDRERERERGREGGRKGGGTDRQTGR